MHTLFQTIIYLYIYVIYIHLNRVIILQEKKSNKSKQKAIDCWTVNVKYQNKNITKILFSFFLVNTKKHLQFQSLSTRFTVPARGAIANLGQCYIC